MKDYPIFVHLKQFSNLLDDQGNFIEGEEIDYKPKQETKKGDEKSEDQNEGLKEGGQPEDYDYEGGDS